MMASKRRVSCNIRNARTGLGRVLVAAAGITLAAWIAAAQIEAQDTKQTSSPASGQETAAAKVNNEPQNPAGEQPDYARDVKPLLQQFCVRCHGPESQKAGLRVDTASGLKTGGDSGAALDLEKLEESLLLQVLTGANGLSKMPPEKEPQLTPEQVAVLSRWVRGGASAPTEEVADRKRRRSEHWAFQPIRRPELPAVTNTEWSSHPIDRFILARLEPQQLTPSPPADRATLLRRMTLDLTGLLPTPEETAEFVADTRADAVERVVDRLLASPHYGERWGRVWLDLARYADSNGFTRDQGRSIWKYRDWVVEALNRDLPFDQFTIEQLAGDMLPNATVSQRVATGFHRNTAFNEEGGTDPEQFRIESVVDRVNTTGAVFLGLTLGCAQCHDHKYDPITQREYYQLFAFLNNADEPKIDVPSAEQLAAGDMERRAEIRRQISELEKQFKARTEEFQKDLDAWELQVTTEMRAQLPIPVANTLNLSKVMRSESDLKALSDYYKALPVARAKFTELDKIAQLKSSEPQFVTTLVMTERAKPRETHVHIRGDFLRPGALVQPDVPEVMPAFPSDLARNRLNFARWLVDQRNPLTARVVVNRVWQKYFGRGLSETENDFGTQGTLPTHPELLDWLAWEFRSPVESTVSSSGADGNPQPGSPTQTGGLGWSFKALHKLIVTSATYQQQSVVRPELQSRDPLNRLYARQNRLRLDAELIRDSALSASGLLCRKLGGPGVYPPQPDGVFDFTQDKKPWKAATDGDRYRRALYTQLWRSSPYPAMTVFDFPDANATCTRRNRSNTPLQSLTLANDEAFVEFARGLAVRVLADNTPGSSMGDDRTRLQTLFQLCLTRAPSDSELTVLSQLLQQQRTVFATQTAAVEQLVPAASRGSLPAVEVAAWMSVARVVFNLDEFVTRE